MDDEVNMLLPERSLQDEQMTDLAAQLAQLDPQVLGNIDPERFINKYFSERT